MSERQHITVKPYVTKQARELIIARLLFYISESERELGEYSGERERQALAQVESMGESEREQWHSLFSGREYVNKRGKIAKRLRSSIARELGYKLTPKQMSAIGNIASEYATASGEFIFELDHVQNIREGEFGDSGSCFYPGSENAHHLRAMANDGRFQVMKVYNIEQEPIARAWVFNAQDGAILVFNAYSHNGLSRVKLASILQTAHDCKPSRAVSFDTDIWQNTDKVSAILGDEHCLDYSAWLSVDEYEYCEYCESVDCNCSSCDECGRHLNTDWGEYYSDEHGNGELYCEHCWGELYQYCEHCEHDKQKQYSDFTEVSGESFESVCDECLENDFDECMECGEYWQDTEKISGEHICENCLDNCGECSYCTGLYYPSRERESEREYCEQCESKSELRASESKCEQCSRPYGELVAKCEQCARGIHHNCEKCLESDLSECSEHYSERRAVVSASAVAFHSYSLFCELCGELGEQVRERNKRGKCESVCLACYAKNHLTESLRAASEHIDSLRELTERAILIVDYQETARELGNERAYLAEYENFMMSARENNHYGTYRYRSASASEFAQKLERELGESLSTRESFRAHFESALGKISESASAIRAASARESVLGELSIQSVSYFSRHDEQERALGTYGAYIAILLSRESELGELGERLQSLLSDRVASELGELGEQESDLGTWQEERASESECGEHGCYHCESECERSYSFDNGTVKQALRETARELTNNERLELARALQNGEHSREPVRERARALRETSASMRESVCSSCTLRESACFTCESASAYILAASIATARESLPHDLSVCASIIAGNERERAQDHRDIVREESAIGESLPLCECGERLHNFLERELGECSQCWRTWASVSERATARETAREYITVASMFARSSIEHRAMMSERASQARERLRQVLASLESARAAHFERESERQERARLLTIEESAKAASAVAKQWRAASDYAPVQERESARERDFFATARAWLGELGITEQSAQHCENVWREQETDLSWLDSIGERSARA
jgi:hypothetical protein